MDSLRNLKFNLSLIMNKSVSFDTNGSKDNNTLTEGRPNIKSSGKNGFLKHNCYT